MVGVLETGVILKIFGVGIAGAVANAVLVQAGKPHIALLLDIGIVITVFVYVAFKAFDAIEHIMTMFGV